MAKALFTPTQIVAKGNELALKTGREPSASDIHKAFDNKGKYSRIKEIWENRERASNQTSLAREIALPDEIRTRTDSVIEQMHQNMVLIISDAVSNAQAAHNRQMVLAERDRQNQVGLLLEEIEHLNTVLEEREQEISDISAELSRQRSAKPAARKQLSKAKLPAQKSQRPPSRTAPLETPGNPPIFNGAQP